MKTTTKKTKKVSGSETVKPKTKATKRTAEKPKTKTTKHKLPEYFSDKLTGWQMAELLGISGQALGGLVQRGRIEREENELYELAKTVRTYCDNLRNRNDKELEASSSGAEFEYWRTAKVKQQSIEGRSQICEEIMSTLLKVWHEIGERMQASFGTSRESEIIKQIFDSFETTAKTVDLRQIGDFEQENMMENDDETKEESDNI